MIWRTDLRNGDDCFGGVLMLAFMETYAYYVMRT